MVSAAFFQTPEAQRILERAAACAGTPISLHYVDHDQEGPLIASWGTPAAACAHVAVMEHGPAACRQSRTHFSVMAAQQQRGMAFVCHLGFACYSVPAIAREHFILTFGPYAVQAAAGALETDVLKGLEILGGRNMESLPFTLNDVHYAPVTLVPAVADWTIEALATILEPECDESIVSEISTETELPSERTLRKRQYNDAHRDPFAARTVALALAGGNQPEARASLRSVLATCIGPKRQRLAMQRARAAAAAAAVLEAAEGAGLPTERAWGALEALPHQLQNAKNATEILDALMGVLGLIRRDAQPRNAAPLAYARLNKLLRECLDRRVPLSEAAQAIGLSPSALSKRLLRDFGMNYSEYLGRLRVEKAKELLMNTALSHTEIARRIGIHDLSNFVRLFRKFEAMTPSDYRERHLGFKE